MTPTEAKIYSFKLVVCCGLAMEVTESVENQS